MAAAFAALLAAAPASAQPRDEAADYPKRAVRIVVPAPAGGGVDVVARILADKLQQRFGQPFVVENRPGAGGNVGAEAVAQAEPDGYTLLAAQPAPLTTNVVLFKKLAFDPAAFEPVAVMSTIPNTLIVRTGLPVNSVPELVAHAKANPGKLNYPSQGLGTTPHLSGELFARLTGTQLMHVPYKGTSQAMNDVVAGHVDLMFLQLDAAAGLHRAGSVKMLGIATPERSPSLPDMPTVAEQGVAGFRSDTWNALAAPPKTPRAITAKLNAAINAVLQAPETQAQFRTMSVQPVGGTPEDMAALVKSETQRWNTVIRDAGIAAQ